jgi:hypothetical protein
MKVPPAPVSSLTPFFGQDALAVPTDKIRAKHANSDVALYVIGSPHFHTIGGVSLLQICYEIVNLG